LHLPGQNLAGRLSYDIFEQRLCKEKEKGLDESGEDGEKRRGNQRELDRRGALAVLDEGRRNGCCVFFLL
jgi:hypothetical protein